MSEDKTMSISFSSTTFLAITVLIASVILSFSILTAANTLGEKINGITIGGTTSGTTTGTVQTQPAQPTITEYLASAGQTVGVNAATFSSCYSTQKYASAIDADYQAGEKLFTESGLKAQGQGGTPTLVIGKPGQTGYIVVGAVPYANIKTVIEGVIDGNVDEASVDATVTNINDYVQGTPLIGQENAEIIIVEFSDFQCPFCKRLVDAAMGQFKQEYIQTGKTKLYFRNYPLSFHQNAMPAALAFDCAREQGKGTEMHDQLFRTQDQWSDLN